LAGRPPFAAGAAALALLAFVLRRKIIPEMDLLRTQIPASGAEAIPRFRRTHLSAILINVAQLLLIVWSLMALSVK
jgi:hypothetical protein